MQLSEYRIIMKNQLGGSTASQIAQNINRVFVFSVVKLTI